MNIILFDGVCNLCNNFVSFLIKHDKNNVFKFAASQTEAGVNIISLYSLSGMEKSVILIKNEIVFYKSDAIIEIAKNMTGWPLIFKYGFLVPKFIRDSIYNVIAKNRYYLFGKKTNCPIPTETDRKRYIL